MISICAIRLVVLVSVISTVIGFIPSTTTTSYGLMKVDTSKVSSLSLQSTAEKCNTDSNSKDDEPMSSRRGFLSTAIAVAGATIVSTTTNIPSANAGGYVLGKKDSFDNTVVGREIASFNDLVYNFKNTALDGGLDASTLKEPSVSFVEFGDRMRKGEVAFVEFFAPSGQVAYVTFKKAGANSDKKLLSNKKNTVVPTEKPIRIGQGYPLGGKNSWSSPDYVIRSVSNFGVPYKFTVPALASAKYKKN